MKKIIIKIQYNVLSVFFSLNILCGDEFFKPLGPLYFLTYN